MIPFAASYFSFLFRSRVIFYIHETTIKPYIFKKFLRYHINLFSDAVIFVSDFLSIEEKFKKPIQATIYNSIDIPIDNGFELNKKFSEKKVLFVGSLLEFK